MNPYEVLGIERNASSEEIKAAYRKAAKKYHPDLNGNSEESQRKFREIQEAYDTLTKPHQNQGHQSQSYQRHPFEDHPFAWAFSEFAQRRANFDIQAVARVSLEQAYNGCELTATVNGKLITIKVPRGAQHGQRLRIDGEGSREHIDLPAGNLIVVIDIEPHSEFEYGGIHLQKTIEVDILDLILGCEIDVRTISGETINVKIPSGTQPNGRIRVRGKGMPIPRAEEQFGDLYLVARAVMPELSEEQIDLLKKARDRSS